MYKKVVFYFISQKMFLCLRCKIADCLVAYVTVTGESMSFGFKADKLMSVLKTVASTASRVKSTASMINSIADSYDGLKVGFELKK